MRRTRPLALGLVGLPAVMTASLLASHRSWDPCILGRYSLPYFAFSLLGLAAVLFAGALCYRFGRRAVYLILLSVILLGLVVVGFELVRQIYAFLRPAYEVLFLEPDRFVGWKQVPGLTWTWAGHHWYSREFSVPVRTNRHGFRDAERELSKPPGVVRIALLGDSLVEALQVPFNKTAGQLLEQRLNAAAHRASGQRTRYEVLNFGISSYGVGQYLLVWEHYASKFGPDYVVIYVAGFHMERTLIRYQTGGLPATGTRTLWTRPTFRLENGTLVREPAADFDAFRRLQTEVIATSFDGSRARRRGPKFFDYGEYVTDAWSSMMALQSRMCAGRTRAGQTNADPDEAVLAVNLRIIEELGRAVTKAGADLVIVDTSRFAKPESTELAPMLKRFAIERRFGYIDLSEDLLTVMRNGISPRWVHDGHFNEIGNEIFANAVYRWMLGEMSSPPSVGR